MILDFLFSSLTSLGSHFRLLNKGTQKWGHDTTYASTSVAKEKNPPNIAPPKEKNPPNIASPISLQEYSFDAFSVIL